MIFFKNKRNCSLIFFIIIINWEKSMHDLLVCFLSLTKHFGRCVYGLKIRQTDHKNSIMGPVYFCQKQIQLN